MSNAERLGKLPDMSGLTAGAVQARKSGHARVAIAPGAHRLGFPAPFTPLDYDHSPGPERVIKLLPDLLADGRQAKACLYSLFVTALMFHQGADDVLEVNQIGLLASSRGHLADLSFSRIY